MKKLKSFTLKKRVIILFALFGTVAANAQKLPNIQKEGVLAPATVKTDGKATEWDDSFQAYNKNTNLYYTIANNSENLYLTVQATDPNDINKITAGGITFTIKNPDKKSIASPVAISYPIKTRVVRSAGGAAPGTPDRIQVISGGPGGGGVSVMRMQIGGPAGGGVRVQSPMQKLRSDQPLTDSDLMALNKQINTNVKEIRVIGVKEFPDSSVSIYNSEGINAAGLISLKKAYTIEFAIAIKYLQPVINSAGTFNYNVQVNGLQLNIMQGPPPPPGGGGDAVRTDVVVVGGFSGGGGGGGGMPISIQSMTSPTDFSGTYTLVKK